MKNGPLRQANLRGFPELPLLFSRFWRSALEVISLNNDGIIPLPQQLVSKTETSPDFRQVSRQRVNEHFEVLPTLWLRTFC